MLVSPPTMHTRALLLALTALGAVTAVLAAQVAAAAPIAVVEHDRGVFARATASETGNYQDTIVPDEALDPGFFASAAQAAAATASSSASAVATQTSVLGAELLSAGGSVRATGSTIDSDGDADAPADSFFEVLFDAGGSEEFLLAGMLRTRLTNDLGDSHASAILVDDATGAEIASLQASRGEQTTFVQSGSLVAGARYRLRAMALARADGSVFPPGKADSAAFQVVLALPEPEAPLLGAAGIAGLALLSALRSARRRERGEHEP